MKKIFTKTLLIFMICVMAFSTVTFAEQNPITVYLNGQQIYFDVQPVIENGRTLVPLRAIFEALGAKVTWNENTRTASGVTSDTMVKITIDDYNLYKNDTAIALDVPARLIDGRTLVPARAISEGMGAKVDWDGANRKVLITVDVPEFAIGTVNDNLYTNTHLRVRAKFPSDWTFATKEDIAAINNIAIDLLNDESYKEAMKNTDMVYDIVAADEIGNNVNMTKINMQLLYEQFPYFISAKDYLEISMPGVEDAIKNMEGASFISSEIVDASFANAPTYAISTSYNLNGINLYCNQIAVRRGDYMYLITATAISRQKANEIIAYFHNLD